MEPPRGNSNLLLTKRCQYWKTNYFTTSLVIILVPTTVILAIVVLTNSAKCKNNFTTTNDKFLYKNLHNSSADVFHLNTYIVKRSEWKATSIIEDNKPLHLPISLIIIAHTAASSCKTYKECSQRVKWIQDYHISSGKFIDIGYNFLIGSDNHIYIGRGWNKTNFIKKNSISICFIGNYFIDELSENMIEVTQELIKYGVKTNIISVDYKLVGHNQTFPTQSPGPNIYKIIKTWPHFDFGRYV